GGGFEGGRGEDARGVCMTSSAEVPPGLAGVVRRLFETSAEALMLFEPSSRRVVKGNAAARGLTGWGPDEFPGRTLDELVACAGPEPAPEVLRRLSAVGRDGGAWHAGRGAFARRRGGELVPVGLTVSRVRAGARPLGLVEARAGGGDEAGAF